MSAEDNLGQQFQPMTSSSKVYNDVPERRGIARGKSTYGSTGRERADAEANFGSQHDAIPHSSLGCLRCERNGK